MMSKARNVEEIVLALRQRGMYRMEHKVMPDRSHRVELAYYAPGTAMQYVTINGLSDLDVLENTLDFLRTHGIPV